MEHPIIYQEINSEHVFVNSNDGSIRLGDFVVSNYMLNSSKNKCIIMPPEIFDRTALSPKSDIFSFGLFMLEILTKEIPYNEAENLMGVYERVSFCIIKILFRLKVE